MIDLDRTLIAMTQAVNTLDGPELAQWIRTVYIDDDPRTLPGFGDFQELFTRWGGPFPWTSEYWPTMHLIIKLAFTELAKVKLETSGLELELQQ